MPDAHYPINFVVKDPTFLSPRKPALRRWKPTAQSRKTGSLFPDRRQSFWKTKINGGDQEAVNDNGGAERDRTADLMLAKHALSQLSYSPVCGPAAEMVGLGRVELPTSPLSGVRSNQLSYRPSLAI